MRVACKAPPIAIRAFHCGRNIPHTGAAIATRACATSSESKVPTTEIARTLPIHMHEVSNETLYILAEGGNHEACRERLVRNVMNVDNLDWMAANLKVKEIGKENHKMDGLATLPYKVGITTMAAAGVGSVPMVFHCGTAKWFNANFVTTDVPEPADLETILEVGSWTWNWMEPPLGVASFVLLAAQFVRSQMLNMDMSPYTNWMQKHRADRLEKLYPQYNSDIVREFASTASLKPKYHKK